MGSDASHSMIGAHTCSCVLKRRKRCHKLKVISRFVLLFFSRGLIPINLLAIEKELLLRRKFGKMIVIEVAHMGNNFSHFAFKMKCLECRTLLEFTVPVQMFLSGQLQD